MSSSTSSSETPAKLMVEEKSPTSEEKLIKPRKVLSIKDKCRIIEKLKSGVAVSCLAKEYKVCKTTIFGIRRKEKQILRFSKQIGDDYGNTRKTMKGSENNSLEQAISIWIKKEIEENGCLPPNEVICNKALRISKKIPQAVEFKATSGWLKRFKARYGLSNAVSNEQGQLNLSPSSDRDNNGDDGDSLCSITITTPNSSYFDVKKEEPLEITDDERDECVSENEWEKDVNTNQNQSSVAADTKIKSNTETVNRNGFIDESDKNAPPKTTHEEAFHAFEILFQWSEGEGNVGMEELLLLRKLQSMAAKRALASLSKKK